MMEAPNRIHIRYLNVQNWTDEKNVALIGHLTITNPDIILITSTSRLSTQTPIKILNYNTFASNKNDERHAGCAISIRKGIKFKIINNFASDCIAAEISTTHGPCIIMTGYLPPRINALPHQDINFIIRNNLPVIMAADLNARHRMFGYGNSRNTKGIQLNNHIYHNRLQYIGPTFNTFYTHNSETKPDCIITNNRWFMNYQITPGGMGPSDHLTINIQISSLPILTPITPTPDIEKTDWDQYKTILETVETIDLDGKNVIDLNNAYKKLYEDIQAAKEATTPLKNIKLINNLKYTTKFKRLTKILDNYHRALMTHGKTEYLSRVIRNTQLLLIEEGNHVKYLWWEEQITKCEEAARSNVRFWKRINVLSGKKKPRTPNLKYMEQGIEKTAETDQDKNKVFTDTCEKVYDISPEENQNFDQANEHRVNQTLINNSDKITPKMQINLQEIRDENQNLTFSIYDVAMAIKYIANKAPGPDTLKKAYLSNLPANIIAIITHLFNCSYQTGNYPSQFKTGEIILFPKENTDTSNPKNYRPISLLNILGKVFAKLLNNKLVNHLEENNIIRPSQHGFRKKKSTSTLLAQLYERIAKEKGVHKKRTMVTMVLRDVSKAFDKIWIKGLIYKMLRLRLEPPLLRTLSSFLTNRKAYIKVNKYKGPTFNLKAGVPQGDVLSPTLFLIYCNDYPLPTVNRRQRNFCKQYADDFTQIIIDQFNGDIDDARRELHRQNIIQEINKQNEYERKWKVSTNIEKFKIIPIGYRKLNPIIIDGSIIRLQETGRILGLDFTTYNFYKVHIDNIVNKANVAQKMLYRFKLLKRKLKLRLYKCLILPLILYPIVPLNVLSKTQLQRLQVIQNNGVRWICNDRWPVQRPLTERHQELRLEYISDRIKRMAETIWSRLEDENNIFFQETKRIQMRAPHNNYPSSYNRTFE